MFKLNRFAVYAWGVLGYNLAVILWGAYVRATGSGAGCGSHWPLCNGEVLPQSPQLETIIEFTHRLSSGLALLLVIGLLVWAFRAYPKGHTVRLGAGGSMFFIITEALVGAGLVLFELVAYDTSTARAVAIAVHLINTFLLLGALTLTAWWASGGQPLKLKGQGAMGWLLGLGLISMLILGSSGAITALGDTLFPMESLRGGLQADFSPAAHFLIRLRLFHPLIAVGVGVYLFLAATFCNLQRPNPLTRRLTNILIVLYLAQLSAGALNVVLLAPLWLQLVHLFFSDLIWITLILLTASTLVEPVIRPGIVSPILQPENQS
jgi:heme A synthase